MELNSNKFLIITGTGLCLLAAYEWTSLFKYWVKLKSDWDQKVLFYERHNCVVAYQPLNGMKGWAPESKRMKPDKEHIFESLYEPILYFIQTAQKSLDISIMLLNVKLVYEELVRASQRGVKIRVLLDFQHARRCRIKSLILKGVVCQFYLRSGALARLEPIMHNKYIIKDYNANSSSGSVCIGSLNLTLTSVLNNYESIVFLSRYDVVKAFQMDFNECWENVRIDNEGIINRSILEQAGLHN